jgi:peptidyl-tRNA hydrolase
MNVLLCTTVYLGSLFHRMAEPARAVTEAGLGIEVTVQRGLKTVMAPDPENPEGPLVVREVDAQGADVVVLQLPKTREMLDCLRLLQAQGVAVVVEVDDHLTALPPGHHGYEVLIRRGVGRLAETCVREADLVTVSTPNLLKEYGQRGHGMVVPNAIPRRIAELPPAYERDTEVVTVGWTGTVGSHPYDLQEMGSGLQQALDRTRGRSRFAIMGVAGDARERLRLAEEPMEIPWVEDVDAYATMLGERLDVGVAPLRIDRHNNCKSWLKVMEYSARGVFAVRSAGAEYERLGLGYRATRPRDWATGITRAIEDADWRREVASANREQVLAHHLTEHTAELWATAWRRARDIRSQTDRIGA